MATLEFSSPTGSVILAGSPAEMADSVNYYGFAFSDNDDWYTIGDSKSDIDERPVSDGAFGILQDWHPSLPVTVNGWYRGPDRRSVRAARRQLALILGQGQNANVRFIDEDEDTNRDVSVRNVDPSAGSSLFFTFAVDLVALDPVAYGQETDYSTGLGTSGGGLLFPLGTTPTKYWDFGTDGTSNRVSITNNGTAEMFPEINVTGGLSGGFIITDVTTDQSVVFDRQIPTTSTITINQRTGQATINGQSDVSGYLTSWDFFSIPPGQTHVIQFSAQGAVTGTPMMTLTASDAWL